MSYTELALEIIYKFAHESIAKDELQNVIEDAAKDFSLPNWTKLSRYDERIFFVELYYGRTFSFKDYAMSIVGRLINFFLGRKKACASVLVATSGDTGSAAIAAFKGLSQTKCFVLFPNERISEIQRLQMTTDQSPNIHVISVRGTFDDCQRLMKKAFQVPNFREHHGLMTVNSVNFGRIVCQIVYYFYAYLRILDEVPGTRKFDVCVPTGNFGNILAGWYAKKMGCPIRKLIIASNENDILPRFRHTGTYEIVSRIPRAMKVEP